MHFRTHCAERRGIVCTATALGRHRHSKLRHRFHEFVFHGVYFGMDLFADIVKLLIADSSVAVFGGHRNGKLRHRPHEFVFKRFRFELNARTDAFDCIVNSRSACDRLARRGDRSSIFKLLDRVLQCFELFPQITDRIFDLLTRYFIDVLFQRGEIRFVKVVDRAVLLRDITHLVHYGFYGFF